MSYEVRIYNVYGEKIHSELVPCICDPNAPFHALDYALSNYRKKHPFGWDVQYIQTVSFDGCDSDTIKIYRRDYDSKGNIIETSIRTIYNHKEVI